jgi:arylsulfatase A-like enzyme
MNMNMNMKMKINRYVLCLVVGLMASPFGYSAPQNARPNIVFFLIDDMGWSDLGVYGSSFYETPNIDRLAADGMRFTDAYSTCHVCSPSRASILTGKYPARIGLTDWINGRGNRPYQRLKAAPNKQALPLEEKTIAEVLHDQGYRTGMFGKWHVGEAEAGPLYQGFDVQVPQNWYKGWPKAGYHYPFKMDGLDGEPGDYLTDNLTDEALQFIEASKDEPFFLYMSFFLVHDPIQGRADLVNKYAEKRRSLPQDDKPFVLEGNPDAETVFTPEQLEAMIETPDYAAYRWLPNRTVKIKQRQDNPQFAAQVEALDENIGRLLAKIKDLGLDENTVVIFTSDNGGMSAANLSNDRRNIDPNRLDSAYAGSNLPLRGAKGWMYEGGIRVPLIVKWPGKIKAGSESTALVTGTDYYPTILQMAGLPLMPEQHVDGVSLAPVLADIGELDRDAIYWHFPHYSNHGLQSPGAAIRSGQYKLLEYFENGTVQLFNLSDDLAEQNDLSKIHPEIVQHLQAKLHEWRDDVGAEMMLPNPGYDSTIKPEERYKNK